MFKYLIIFLLFLVALAIIYTDELNPGGDTPSPNEIEFTEKQKTEFKDAIQDAGFMCPEVKFGWKKGVDHYGKVIKVFCGPPGIDGVYEKGAYRITFRPNGGINIQPSKD